jgi:hypothetical protein
VPGPDLTKTFPGKVLPSKVMGVSVGTSVLVGTFVEVEVTVGVMVFVGVVVAVGMAVSVSDGGGGTVSVVLGTIIISKGEQLVNHCPGCHHCRGFNKPASVVNVFSGFFRNRKDLRFFRRFRLIGEESLFFFFCHFYSLQIKK